MVVPTLNVIDFIIIFILNLLLLYVASLVSEKGKLTALSDKEKSDRKGTEGITLANYVIKICTEAEKSIWTERPRDMEHIFYVMNLAKVLNYLEVEKTLNEYTLLWVTFAQDQAEMSHELRESKSTEIRAKHDLLLSYIQQLKNL